MHDFAKHDDSQSDDKNLFENPAKSLLDEIYAALDAAGVADFNLERDLSPSVEKSGLGEK